jgi:hypothetical protein
MVRDTDPGVTPTAPRTGGRARLRALLDGPLPTPPDALRQGPLRRGAFPSRLRSPRLTSQLGIALAVAFGICFLTGLISHLIQHPPGWFRWPSRPVGLYRFTQGLHVATGLATVPLLGVKLWSVYPRLFAWPPARTVAHAAERLGVAALAATALFQVVSGVFNVARWYAPMPFFFTAGHYRVAWLAIGALLVHVGVKLPIVRAGLRRVRAGGPRLRRRELLGAVGAAAGVVTLGTVGQALTPLAGVSVLAPRRPRDGPQGLTVNQSAVGAGVVDAALDPGYRLTVVGPGGSVALSLADLATLPQHTAVLPIACVEGWSAAATWTGVRLRDLVALVDVDPDDAVAEVESLQAGGRYRSSIVAPPHTRDPLTLVALGLNGGVLHLDHGYPARLIASEPPRRDADQVAPADHRAEHVVRRALITGGVLVMGYAVVSASTDRDVTLLGVAIFLAAVLVAHDGVLLPAMIGIGALIGRLTDPTPVRVAAICSTAIALVGVPLMLGYADLPPSRILLVLGLIWAAALVTMTARRIRKHLARCPSVSASAPDR